MKLKRLIGCMLACVVLAGCFFLSACTDGGPPSPSAEDLANMDYMDGFVPVWRDEFSGTALDSAKWQHEVRGNWYNNEIQYYDEDGASVSNGTLKITARKDSKAFTRNGLEIPMDSLVFDPNSTEKDPLFRFENGNRIREYGSSRIRSYEKFSQTFGRFEARIKMPAVEGLWPAFWMMPEANTVTGGGWPRNGEIDIMEARGRIPEHCGQAVHFGAGTGGRHFYISNPGDHVLTNEGRIDAWHNYAVEWSEEQIVWLIDDEPVFSIVTEDWSTRNSKWIYGENGDEKEQRDTNTAQALDPSRTSGPFDRDFYMILNLAVGGIFDEGRKPPEDFTEASMEIDWVRVWQWERYIA